MFNSADRISNNQSGFTLVEMLLVSVLLAMMAGILYGSINGIIRTKTTLEKNRNSVRIARTVLERLTREFSSSIQEPLNSQNRSSQNLSSQLNPSFASTNKTEGTSDTDSIRFVTTSGSQSVFGAYSNYGLVEVEYRLVPESKDNNENYEEVDREIPVYTLVREEKPVGVSDQEILDKRKIIFPLATHLVSLNFRFHDRGKWSSRWPAQRTTLPEAIEITLKVLGSENSIETFRTAVSLNHQGPTMTPNSIG